MPVEAFMDEPELRLLVDCMVERWWDATVKRKWAPERIREGEAAT
jgi:hypothetical protein